MTALTIAFLRSLGRLLQRQRRDGEQQQEGR